MKEKKKRIPPSKRKTKGSIFERQLITMFWNEGWAASRIAGSGSTKYFSPDIIAGKERRIIVIEAKTTIEKQKYLTKTEVEELKEYAKIMGAESWISVKFKNNNIKFVSTNNVKTTKKSIIVKEEDPLLFSFEELIKP